MSQRYDELLGSVIHLAENLHGIREVGVAPYTPVVETILRTRRRDVRHIEDTLDHLLAFACHPDGLLLNRRLCRHYWELDPAATAAYTNAYRERWEEDEEEKP